jgi:hypothetical protein
MITNGSRPSYMDPDPAAPSPKTPAQAPFNRLRNSPAIVDLTVQPLAANRSELTISVDFTGHGIGRVLVPLMVRREAVKEMPVNLARLKQRLEQRP